VLARAAAARYRAGFVGAVPGAARVTPQDFDFIRRLLKQHSGLMLSAEKQYLVESRLMPLAQRAGIDLAGLVRKLRSGDEAVTVEVVEAMTTNETFFFRDKLPFEHFRTFIMPSLLATRARHKRIRIWCAAASTGQEPYSFAMALKEMGKQVEDFRIEILATDLSLEVLEKAKAGIYSQFEVQRGLPIQMLLKYFKQDGEMWQIAPEIRAMVQYRPLNLLADFSRNGIFDLVVCRNVLIYFDQETKTEVIDRLARVIAPDGYLILGAAETTIGLSQAFKAITERRGLYTPVDRSVTPADRVMTRLSVGGTQLASRL
jgi:chemotaxis protein methyltransferase CheR